VSSVDEMNDIHKRLDRIDRDSAHHGRFFGVDFRNDNAGDFSPSGFDSYGEGAANAANAAIEGEFAHEEAVGNLPFNSARHRHREYPAPSAGRNQSLPFLCLQVRD